MPDGWLGEETVGELIAGTRERLGKSQYTLAEDLAKVCGRGDGVPDRNMVARWETGRRIPTPYWRAHLAAVLQIPPALLDRAAAISKAQRAHPEVTGTPPSDNRLRHHLSHPGSVDLVSVAYLRESVRRLDEQYDRAPSTKQAIRNRIWDLLERERVVERGVHGYIPAFAGSDAAADQLGQLPAWHAARVVKVVPDRAQRPVRNRALREGKLLYMPVPMLADEPPFYVLDPTALAMAPETASSEDVARMGGKIGIHDMKPIDMVICGSVAVNRDGSRLGKGAGYSDIEVALLNEAGLLGPHTLIVTTVHPLQVIEEPLPETGHDFSVDLIVTTGEVIQCGNLHRPDRIYWDHLTPEKIAAIPVLAARQPRSGTSCD